MKYDDPLLRDVLVAQYVLGTLRGGARRRCEQLLAIRRDWQQSADWWSGRLHLLADAVPSEQVPQRVWQGIERRVYGNGKSTATGWWRGLALVSSTIAAVLIFFTASNLLHKPAASLPARVALLSNDQAKPGWILSLAQTADGKAEIRVAALATLSSVPDKSFELWVLPPGKAAPVSLGLLPQQGNSKLGVSKNMVALLVVSGLAVSLEPVGGSPTGQPTGAVLYQGKLTPI